MLFSLGPVMRYELIRLCAAGGITFSRWFTVWCARRALGALSRLGGEGTGAHALVLYEGVLPASSYSTAFAEDSFIQFAGVQGSGS